MIVLWILLGILAAVFLLLLVPVHADVRYRERLELDVRYLFLRRTLLPAPEEPQAEKAEARTVSFLVRLPLPSTL